MCGLSGAAGSLSIKEENAVKDFLCFGYVRGKDSTGLGAVSRKDSDFYVAKVAGPYPDLYDSDRFQQIFQGINKTYIGHNRAKTVGNLSRKNAHPFQFDFIMGAHNGSIDYQNKNRLDDGAKFGTDSEAIIWNIEKNGIEKTVSEIDTTEALALVWFNTKLNTINLFRNKHRPLLFGYSDNHKVLFWNSEWELMAPSIYRNQMKLDEKVNTIPDDMWFSWEIPELGQAFKKPKAVQLKGRENKWGIGYRRNGYYEEGNDDDTSFFGNVKKNVGTIWFPPSKDTEGGTSVTTPNKADKQSLGISEEHKVLSIDDVLQRKTAEELPEFKDEVIKKQVHLHERTGLRMVFRNKETGLWIIYHWAPKFKGWIRAEYNSPPNDMPYHKLDVNARHEFKHIRYGKHNKEIVYRGFKGAKLNEMEFTRAMHKGCLSCARTPEWGNKVTFLDQHDNFLCEYCGLDEKLVKDFIEVGKTSGVARL